jgi:hypothetical protein
MEFPPKIFVGSKNRRRMEVREFDRIKKQPSLLFSLIERHYKGGSLWVA